ncbi:hypothetical protein [Bacteriovorax sp. DB6_IX]|uniref:hypothetical protein n=1 Tax=Bacteriovorax sp. DB6_IX TaxID=1353530 RepID=UPI000389E0B7|nr:hypothetical protein [Bacteriovorax sp. DB6_IX]EQC50901.1 hypothetical protein M901_2943 [Bacteriovorax sp. DB6_IX]
MLRILALLLLTFEVYAVMFVDIEVTHEKGLGKKMILKSEIMSRERVQPGKPITLRMKNGILVDLEAKFAEDVEELGPSSIVEMQGSLKNTGVAQAEKTFKIVVKINHSGSIELKDDLGQKTTIKVTPRVK